MDLNPIILSIEEMIKKYDQLEILNYKKEEK